MTKDEDLLKALRDIKDNAGNPEQVYLIASAAIKQALPAPAREPVSQEDQSNRCPQCRLLTLCAQCKALR